MSRDVTNQIVNFISTSQDACREATFTISRAKQDNNLDNESFTSQQDRKDITTLKQQLFIMQLLNDYKILKLNNIHDNMTNQARFLTYLLNRSYENTYKYLKDIRKYPTKENLRIIKKAFDHTLFDEIKKHISRLMDESDLNQ